MSVPFPDPGYPGGNYAAPPEKAHGKARHTPCFQSPVTLFRARNACLDPGSGGGNTAAEQPHKIRRNTLPVPNIRR